MLKTEHTLVCDVCGATQSGGELGQWIEVVVSETDYAAGYSQFGYKHYRKARHACSAECYETLGRQHYWPREQAAAVPQQGGESDS